MTTVSWGHARRRGIDHKRGGRLCRSGIVLSLRFRRLPAEPSSRPPLSVLLALPLVQAVLLFAVIGDAESGALIGGAFLIINTILQLTMTRLLRRLDSRQVRMLRAHERAREAAHDSAQALYDLADDFGSQGTGTTDTTGPPEYPERDFE